MRTNSSTISTHSKLFKSKSNANIKIAFVQNAILVQFALVFAIQVIRKLK